MSEENILRPGHSGKWGPPSDEPLTTVDHTNFKKLMSLREFTGRPRIALACFKSRWNDSPWMQAQKGYLGRACLAAASGNYAYCQCGLNYFDRTNRHRFQRCRTVYLCPSCNWHERVEPCEREYLPAFERAPFWYAGSVGWQSSPRKAGFHWVTRQDAQGRATAKKHWRSLAERPDAPYSERYRLDNMDAIQLMAELPFEFMKQLDKRKWFHGMYCVFEWHFDFRPSPGGNWCVHTALPHVHYFGNRTQPLTFEDGIQIHRLYQRTCLKHLGTEMLPSYPDLEIAPIISPGRLKGWMNYQIKSMPIEKMYMEGIRHGCSLSALNMEFDQTVWDLIKLVRSPRKYGNLFVRGPSGSYLGVRQYALLTKSQRAALTIRREAGQVLTEREARQLEHHALACEQQKQYRLEAKRRREQARLRRPDLAVPGKSHPDDSGGVGQQQ